MTPATTAAVERGLGVAGRQQEEDGSFGSGGYSRNVAVCGLAGMAFLAGGSTPRRGPHGANVERCVDFILANTQESGFINVASRQQPRSDVWPRLRHAVSGRELRHDARGRTFAKSWPRRST